jgi:hypothetical protein
VLLYLTHSSILPYTWVIFVFSNIYLRMSLPYKNSLWLPSHSCMVLSTWRPFSEIYDLWHWRAGLSFKLGDPPRMTSIFPFCCKLWSLWLYHSQSISNLAIMCGWLHQSISHHPLHWQDKTAPGRTDSKRLSSQVKPVPHSIDSSNLLECHPSQRQ